MRLIFRSMSPKGAPCYNCQQQGHISADCPKPWRNFRCLNCTKTHVHAESCSSKWFNLRANFTQCENADESREFNRLEYQRQQLGVAINQMRGKRSALTPGTLARRLVVKVSEEIPPPHRLAIQSARPRPALLAVTMENHPAVEPAPLMPELRRPLQKNVQAVKRTRVIELKDEDLAQQIADWPDHQPAPEGPDMRYDAAEIANFLQHAARFVLRYETAPTQEDIDHLMNDKVTWLYGRPKESVSTAELVVRTVKKWQEVQEINTMMHNVPRWADPNVEEKNPIGFQIHRTSSGRREVFPRFSKTSNVRSPAVSSEQASIEEVFQEPNIKPAMQWVLRWACAEGGMIAIGDEGGDINEIDGIPRDLSDGLRVRRDGGMVQFDGPPTFDVSFSLEYADRVIRLRLCTAYVIVDEQFRLDGNGVSRIMKNDEALRGIPKWEISFLGVEFPNTRVRFAEQRARLQLRDGDLELTAV